MKTLKLLFGIILMTFIMSCEKEEIECLKTIEHYTITFTSSQNEILKPNETQYKRILIFNSNEVPESYTRGNVSHRFKILGDECNGIYNKQDL